MPIFQIMGGVNPNNNPELSAMKKNSGANANVMDFESTRPWEIKNPHPEKITEGIAKGVSTIATGLASGGAGGMKPDATAQAASAGKVGPVADMSATSGVAASKQYMNDPTLANYIDMQYPTAFKYQYN
jgi:hypothetical protein